MSKAVAAIMEFFGWGQSGDTISRTETIHNFQASSGRFEQIGRVYESANESHHGSYGGRSYSEWAKDNLG